MQKIDNFIKFSLFYIFYYVALSIAFSSAGESFGLGFVCNPALGFAAGVILTYRSRVVVVTLLAHVISHAAVIALSGYDVSFPEALSLVSFSTIGFVFFVYATLFINKILFENKLNFYNQRHVIINIITVAVFGTIILAYLPFVAVARFFEIDVLSLSSIAFRSHMGLFLGTMFFTPLTLYFLNNHYKGIIKTHIFKYYVLFLLVIISILHFSEIQNEQEVISLVDRQKVLARIEIEENLDAVVLDFMHVKNELMLPKDLIKKSGHFKSEYEKQNKYLSDFVLSRRLNSDNKSGIIKYKESVVVRKSKGNKTWLKRKRAQGKSFFDFDLKELIKKSVHITKIKDPKNGNHFNYYIVSLVTIHEGRSEDNYGLLTSKVDMSLLISDALSKQEYGFKKKLNIKFYTRNAEDKAAQSPPLYEHTGLSFAQKNINGLTVQLEFEKLGLHFSGEGRGPLIIPFLHFGYSQWPLIIVVGLLGCSLVVLNLLMFDAHARGQRSITALKKEVFLKEQAQKMLSNLNVTLDHEVKNRTRLLLARTNELEAVFKVFPDYLFIVNHKGIISTVVSPSGVLENFSIEDIENTHVDRYVCEGDRAKVKRAIAQVLLHDVTIRNELDVALGEHLLHVEACIVRYDAHHVLLMARDVSEKISLERKIEEQNIRALSSSRLAALGEMAGGIAHEINNPLAIIDGSAQLLSKMIDKDRLDKDNAKVTLSRIHRTVDRIAKIINGLKKFVREDSAELSPVKIETFLEEVLSFCRERFLNQGVQLNVENFAKEEYVYCNQVELSQVLINLLNNSYDAICTAEERWVRVEVSETPKKIKIRVIDSGHGIEKETAQKIMEPFFTTKQVGGGTGLGLSISRSIMKSHGGGLRVISSSPNTCFEISLLKQPRKAAAS